MNEIGRPDIQSVLTQMRAMRGAANGALMREMQGADRADTARAPEQSRFGDLLESAVSKVNAAQQESALLKEAFVRGETQDLVRVMVSMQKSSVSFQAMTQVRNRLVSAYQDIMNMPI